MIQTRMNQACIDTKIEKLQFGFWIIKILQDFYFVAVGNA